MSELSFWAELKRRRVYRTAAWYAASMFVIWQVADLVVPALGLPAWAMKAVIIVSAIGFIPTLVLSWLYDIKGADSVGRASRTRRALWRSFHLPCSRLETCPTCGKGSLTC
jgi:hypothetical protein